MDVIKRENKNMEKIPSETFFQQISGKNSGKEIEMAAHPNFFGRIGTIGLPQSSAIP